MSCKSIIKRNEFLGLKKPRVLLQSIREVFEDGFKIPTYLETSVKNIRKVEIINEDLFETLFYEKGKEEDQKGFLLIFYESSYSYIMTGTGILTGTTLLISKSYIMAKENIAFIPIVYVRQRTIASPFYCRKLGKHNYIYRNIISEMT